MADVTLTAELDFSDSEKRALAVFDRIGRGASRLGASGSRAMRPLGEGLSAATANASEFDKSLAAANARVLAFGASAGLIIKMQQAFVGLLKTTIDVEKRLKDINVVLGADTKTLARFGDSLFRIAKETGQSFDVVATAATELSRQGLSVEKTLLRTKDALILTRLSGMDAESSVEALTAALNTFTEAGIDSSVIVNKLAKVDAAFAVSSADLAEALKRVGASAQGAGVSLDELLGIITATQQKTARGGSVLGNSFKTIFTRISRPEVLNQLEELGIAVRTVSGETLPAIKIMKSLAETYDKLGSAQKSIVSEQVAGVFQINILKALLSDLTSEYSITTQATRAAASATSEAVDRNKELNETMATLLNRTIENSKQFAASVGNISFAPAMKLVLSEINELLESTTISESSQKAGNALGRGILEGLGKFISGPALMGTTIVISKLLIGFVKFGYDALKAFLGANSAAAQQKQLQEGILNTLRQQPGILKAVLNGHLSIDDVANGYIQTLRMENALMEKQAALANQVGAALYGSGARMVSNSATGSRSVDVSGVRRVASGYVPSFFSMNDKRVEESEARALGASPGVRARRGRGTIGGRSFLMNSEEVEIPSFGKNGDSAVIPMYGGGFLPNFAKSADEVLQNALNSDRIVNLRKIASGQGIGAVASFSPAQIEAARAALAKRDASALAATPEALQALSSPAAMIVPYARQGTIETVLPVTRYSYRGKDYRGLKLPIAGLDPAKVAQSNNSIFDEGYILAGIADRVSDLTKEYAQGLAPLTSVSSLPSKQQLLDGFKTGRISDGYGGSYNIAGVKSISAAAGSAFDIASTLALQLNSEKKAKGAGDFDVRGSAAYSKLKKVFSIDGRAANLSLGDFKIATSSDAIASMSSKIQKELSVSKGALPNFSALAEAIAREKAAGIPSYAIRVGRSASLASSSNPGGIAVYNTIDEPRGLSQGINRYRSAGLDPKSAGMPNFAAPFGPPLPPGHPAAPPAPRITPGHRITAYDKHVQIVIKRFIKQKISIDEATKAIQDLAKVYSATKRKVNRNLMRLMRAEEIIISSKEKVAKVSKDLEKNPKQPLSMGRLAAAGFGAQMISSQFATQFPESGIARGSEAFVQGATSGGAFGSMLGPQGAIAGALIGGVFSTMLNINKRHAEQLEKNRQLQEDNLGQLNTFMGVFAEGDSEKTAKAFNELPESIRKSIGSIDQLSEKTLAVARDMAQGSAVLANFQASLSVASKASISESFLSFMADNNVTGNLIAGKDDILSMVRGQQSRRQSAAGKEFISRILSTGFGNQPLAGALTDQDVQELVTGGNTKEISARIFERSKVPDSQKLLLMSALRELQGVSKLENVGSGSIYSQLEIFREFAERKGVDDDKARNLAETLDLLKISSARYGSSGLALARGGARPRILSGQYGGMSIGGNIGLSGAKMLTSKGRQDVSGVFDSLQEVARNSSGADIGAIRELIEGGKYSDVVGILETIQTDTPEALRMVEDLRVKLLQIQEENTVGGILGRNFRFDAQDQFDFILDRVDKVSAAMKTSFGDSFHSFVTGAESAGDAFRNFALSVMDNLSRMATDYVTSQLFGLIGSAGRSLFSSGSGSSSIGLFGSATKKARGGMVHGGSGVRDDVPALLTGGEYVIRKSAVDSLGVGYLDRINRYADGGLVLDNRFDVGSGKNRGSFNVSKRLSYSALMDSNNPQNALRGELNEQDLARIQGIEDYEANKSAAMSAFKKKKRQALIGGYIQAGMAIGMGAIQQTLSDFSASGPNQNPQGHGASGPPTQKAYNQQNQPKIYRQYGGSVNRGITPIQSLSGGQSSSGVSNEMLIAAINGLSASMAAKPGSGGDVRIQEAGAQTNNISITVNVSESGGVEASSENPNNSGGGAGSDKNNKDRRQERDLGMMIKNVVVQTITEQKRPGGLLSKAG